MRVLLALPLVVTAACGDNLIGPGEPAGNGADQSGAAAGDVTARYEPEICGAETFASVQLDAKASAVRAVPSVGATALFMVPKSGGTLRGVLVDGRGYVIGNPDGQKIRSDAAFTSLSASRVDDRFVLGLVADGATHITVVRDDLGDFRELAVAAGELTGDTSMMHVRSARVATTGSGKGLVATTFDENWVATGSQIISPSVATSMMSAAYGSDAVVAWSTADECHLRRVAAGVESVQPYACQNGRLAVDFGLRGGWMVYERGDGIMLSRIDANASVHSMIGNPTQLVALGRSPRIAFDGETFWTSYLDAHGDVVVGMLDETGGMQTAAINEMTPSSDGYDLVVGSGSASVYGIVSGRLGATHVCKTQQP